MRIFLMVIAAAVLSTACASTDPRKLVSLPPDRAELQRVDCGDETSQLGMNDCFGRQARQVEGLMESLLKELGRVLEARERKQLQAVQKKWLGYRAAQCEFDAPIADSGSILPTLWATCMTSATWQRINELKYNLCEGRGMTGACEASRRYDGPVR